MEQNTTSEKAECGDFAFKPSGIDLASMKPKPIPLQHDSYIKPQRWSYLLLQESAIWISGITTKKGLQQKEKRGIKRSIRPKCKGSLYVVSSIYMLT